MDLILNCVVEKVTADQNARLQQPVTKEEVRDAVFSMHLDKAAGPDGLNPGFYRSFWQMVGDDISAAVLACLNNNCAFPGENHTNNILILKKEEPEQISDLRPISLCNVVDRISSKVLANRMRACMDGVISIQQSAFIPDRYITDNAMIAFELIHFLRRKTQ